MPGHASQPRGAAPEALLASALVLGALAAGAVLLDARPDPSAPASSVGGLRIAAPGMVGAAGEADAGRAQAPAPGPTRGRLAFRFQTGGRITGRVAVGAGGEHVFVASHDGRLYALTRDGALRFARPLGAPAFGGPLLLDGRLHVGTDAGVLLAFDAASGRELRRVQLPAAVERAPVALPGGRLACAAGAELIVLDGADGRVLWRFAAGAKIFGGPVSDGRRIVFGAQDHHLYVLSLDGAQRAAVDLGADVDATPAIGPGGVIYVGADDGRLHAVGPGGEVRWSRELGGRLRAPVALAGEDRLLAVSHGLRPALHLLARGDGGVVGRQPLGQTDSDEYFLRSGPLIGPHGSVYLGAPGQRVLALDAEGRTRFGHATGGHVHATPVLAPDGTLYVGADDGVLYAFRDEP